MDIDLRNRYVAWLSQFDLSIEQYMLLRRAYTNAEVMIVLELFRVPSPNGYQSYCRGIVRRWLRFNHATKPPLTYPQLLQLVPSYPIEWELPK